MTKEATLWLRNDSASDVSLSDLGVKVPRGKTVNVFKVNPYLTQDKVKASLESGSLAKRLSSGVLVPVEGPSTPRPATLDHIKQSNEPVLVKKTNTSVVVEPGNPKLEEEESSEGFGFADYGINDLGEAVSQERVGAAVVVSAKQDEEPAPPAEAQAEPVGTTNPISKQSVVTMQAQQAALSHPMGKVAQPANQVNQSQPFVVTKPPADEPEDLPIPPVQQEIKPSVRGNVITPQEGTFLAERDMDLIQALNKRAEELGVKVDDLPEATVIEVEAQVIGDKIIEDEAEERFDSQVATKTAEGATVMKIKEVGEEDAS